MLHRVTVVVSLCFVAFTAAASGGCSSSDSGSPAPSDGGNDTFVADAGNDTRIAPVDSTPLDATPAACFIITSARPEVQKCDACSQPKCKSQREACYGSAYLSGTFGGSCVDYAKCLCTCKETDDICQENCKVEATTACNTCLKTIDDCETTNCSAECTPF